MGQIVYDEKTLLDAINKIDGCNEKLLDALEKIDIEFNNMGQILSTPKSNKAIPEFINYIDDKIVFVQNNKEKYNKMFNTINGEYHNYSDFVNRMVSDINEK